MFFNMQWKKIFFALTVVTCAVTGQRCEYETIGAPVNCEENPVVLQVISVEDADCALMDGVITVTASGGSGVYRFTLDGNAPQTDSVFEDLGAGIHEVSASDSRGCSSSIQVTVKNRNGLNVNFQVTAAGCDASNGSISVSAVDGTAPFAFSINNGDFSSVSTFEGLPHGDHTVAVKDATGCTITQKIKVPSGVSYASSVAPIIEKSCAISGCHNGSQFPDFRVFKNIHDNSARIKELTGDGTMPQEGTLTQAQIKTIACWVDDGAPDN